MDIEDPDVRLSWGKMCSRSVALTPPGRLEGIDTLLSNFVNGQNSGVDTISSLQTSCNNAFRERCSLNYEASMLADTATAKGPVPHSFGMAWADQGVHGRYGHRLRLWTAKGDTTAFHDAYRAEKTAMIDAGYSWRQQAGGEGWAPCFWELSEPVWNTEVAGRIEAAILAIAAQREAIRLRSQDRLADECARVAISSAPIRADLDSLLAERPWAFGKKLTEAEEMAAMSVGEWTSYGAACAGVLVDNAKRAILRAEERLSKPAPEAWYERAADPAVRAAVLVACKVLSDRDSDRASIRNGRGWSQATSWTGHVLSGRDSLTQAEAAHGLALLWGHRSQIPADLRVSVFEGQPKPASFMHP